MEFTCNGASVNLLMRSGKALKKQSDNDVCWKFSGSLSRRGPCPLLGCSHTHCPAVRDGSKEKQEANREAFLARIPWKPRLGRHEQRQERKGPLILRGEHSSAASSKLPTAVFLPEQ